MKERGGDSILLLDSGGAALARARLEGGADGEVLQLLVLDGKAQQVAQHQVIQLVGMGDSGLALQCQTLRRRGDRMALNKVARLGPDFKLNLRLPVRFKSFFYPVSGRWRGRRPFQSVELSCTGIAFYAATGLEDWEIIEAVIPITVQPLVLTCTVRSHKPLRDGRCFYSAEFTDLCNDEESILREAVFRQQLENRFRQPKEDETAEVET